MEINLARVETLMFYFFCVSDLSSAELKSFTEACFSCLEVQEDQSDRLLLGIWDFSIRNCCNMFQFV